MAADLHKKPERKSAMEIYAPYCIVICLIVLVLLIIVLILTFANIHAFQLTGTEANHWQNMRSII